MQRYQKIAEERYAIRLADYEERLRKAQEEGKVPIEESKKAKKATTTKKKKPLQQRRKEQNLQLKSQHQLRAKVNY